MRNPSPAVDVQVAPVAPQRIFQEVADQLRRSISEGRLKPGDKLPPERELAQLFGVSRNTMREALRALELSGLVEMKLGATGGAFVLEGSSNAVVNGMRDLYFLGAITPDALTEARIAISASVLRVAVPRITPSELDGLRANVAAAEAAHLAGDFAERTRHHQAFHVLLANATHNPILVATMEGVMEVTRQFVKAIGPQDWPTHTLASRRRLLQHLGERDAEAAVKEMTAALRKLHQGYLVMAQGAKPGEPVAAPAKKAAGKKRQAKRP
jgi:GntR family transcriptional regulator, transcriptional repressor for pyruvate dehydrogenase complex